MYDLLLFPARGKVARFFRFSAAQNFQQSERLVDAKRFVKR